MVVTIIKTIFDKEDSMGNKIRNTEDLLELNSGIIYAFYPDRRRKKYSKKHDSVYFLSNRHRKPIFGKYLDSK